VLVGASQAPGPSQAGAGIRASGTIRWLAAGDSYSAGQGLNNTTEPCARGDFEAGSLAYPVLAYDDLREAMPNLATPKFVACTGA